MQAWEVPHIAGRRFTLDFVINIARRIGVKISGIPNYRDLDLSGESRAAARRMEDRAVAPASRAMFEDLVAPLLDTPSGPPSTILEVGCGSAALSRRVARRLPGATVYASDKSEGMLAAAREFAEAERGEGGAGGELVLGRWDVGDPAAFPFDRDRFDVILSSVMAPYLDDEATVSLVEDLASRLASGGILAFIEQDLTTDTVNFPDFDLLRRVYARDERDLKRMVALGLRPILREAGLRLLPRRSFLWTDDEYLPYTRDLLDRIGADAQKADRITTAERGRWTETLESLAAAGDFYYGIVYHRIAGQAPS
ncbi:MAG: class I SAM-dependent methyltransferase [Rubrobacteraceae bacterium]|nr:methyltransferase domain-containing protein [Rubrobacter sp.]